MKDTISDEVTEKMKSGETRQLVKRHYWNEVGKRATVDTLSRSLSGALTGANYHIENMETMRTVCEMGYTERWGSGDRSINTRRRRHCVDA